MLTQGPAPQVSPIALFQLYVVKTKCCSPVPLLRKDKLRCKCMRDRLVKRLIVVFYGHYLLTSCEVWMWCLELSEPG